MAFKLLLGPTIIYPVSHVYAVHEYVVYATALPCEGLNRARRESIVYFKPWNKIKMIDKKNLNSILVLILSLESVGSKMLNCAHCKY
jgi:hypothetical protein